MPGLPQRNENGQFSDVTMLNGSVDGFWSNRVDVSYNQLQKVPDSVMDMCLCVCMYWFVIISFVWYEFVFSVFK